MSTVPSITFVAYNRHYVGVLAVGIILPAPLFIFGHFRFRVNEDIGAINIDRPFPHPHEKKNRTENRDKLVIHSAADEHGSEYPKEKNKV